MIRPCERHSRDEVRAPPCLGPRGLHHDPDPMPVKRSRPARRRHRHRRLAAVAAAAPNALLAVSGTNVDTADAAVKHYWIKAVNTKWDVAPNGQDVIMKRPIELGQRQLDAVIYRAYTPGWKKPLPNRVASGDNDGV